MPRWSKNAPSIQAEHPSSLQHGFEQQQRCDKQNQSRLQQLHLAWTTANRHADIISLSEGLSRLTEIKPKADLSGAPKRPSIQRSGPSSSLRRTREFRRQRDGHLPIEGSGRLPVDDDLELCCLAHRQVRRLDPRKIRSTRMWSPSLSALRNRPKATTPSIRLTGYRDTAGEGVNDTSRRRRTSGPVRTATVDDQATCPSDSHCC